MRSITPRRVVALLGLGWMLVAGARAAEVPEKPSEPPPRIVPHPRLVEYATAQAVPVAKIEVPAAKQPYRAGDSITALISLRDGRKEQQWLMTLQVSTRTEAEKKAKVEHVTIDVTVNGHSYKFVAASTLPVDIVTTGPFAPGNKNRSETKRARSMVSPEFLALGMDGLGAGMIALEKSKSNEMPESVERAYAGLFPALGAFFEAVQTVPTLKSIVWDVIDLPSAWSMVKGMGTMELGFGLENFAAVDAAEWGPGLDVYRMGLPMTMNSQPALNVTFFVTAPKPPLLTTAGVVGIVATHPKKKEKRLEIRVVSARAGTP